MSDRQAAVTFFDGTYEEALGLACELRDRIAAKGDEGRSEAGDYANRLYSSCECLRMTARLTQVIAWFLVQKAVHAGELSREEARAKHRRLGGHEVCDPGREFRDAGLTPVLADLQQRTGRLYVRVARLDAMMNR